VILACASCDSRYDVSGHAVGQQFRCRCGTLMTLDAPTLQAGLLACPHCGAGVSPSSPRCEHCSSELLVKGCPRCLSRVFHGYKHCPDCGGELDVAAIGEVQDRACPRCAVAMRARLIGDVVVDECGTCFGLFLDSVAIKRVVEDRHQTRADVLLGELPRQPVKAEPMRNRPMYVRCPICSTLMNRRLFALGLGVVVDVCRGHGTFFDRGELPEIIDFVMKGGLDIARSKELEAERARLRSEASALRTADSGGLFSIRPDTSHLSGRGTALVDLLFALFR
jgi:Zn-finger nucleic acid-binding protein